MCFPHPPFIISPRLLLSMHLAHRSTSLDSMSHALCIPSPLGIDTAPCLGETTAARALLDRAASLFFTKRIFQPEKQVLGLLGEVEKRKPLAAVALKL